MSTLSLALITITVVIAVLIATRPAPRSNRRNERRSGDENKKSPDPLPPRGRARLSGPTPAQILEQLHRNRWDRRDLAIAVGRDDQASEPTLMLWPAPAAAWTASV